MTTVQTHRELAFLQRARRASQKPEREVSMVGLGAGVEFVVGAGVDVSSAGR